MNYEHENNLLQEDDPYEVYMLRRPAERASLVIPQLPKQPEMASTRLRYRRIPPEATSGSLGSLGNHFPPRFHFPNRPSHLDSLTSDEDSSFGPPRRLAALKRRKKVRRNGKPPLAPGLAVSRAALAAAEVPPPAKKPARPRRRGLTALADGRVISAPEAMNPALRERFVLQAELPVRYGGRERREEGGEEFLRETENSVSFAHRRYTAEEAAAKRLNAIQRLWQVLALARMGRRGRRR